MQIEHIEYILKAVKSGEMQIDEAMQRLKHLPYEDLEFARIDHHRRLRTGFPEVIFCQGKAPEHIVAIMKRAAADGEPVLATRAEPALYDYIRQEIHEAVYHRSARIITLNASLPQPGEGKGLIAVVSAGTADIPVAEEAVVTAAVMGNRVERLFDVGVAGLHRLLDKMELLTSAKVLIVVAGMEGALASVIGGLVESPVIAVPTSIGYGASFQGLAALLSMLNSCAAGVTVVNIDNGFGAGYFAGLINGPL
jgi:NCAIR mutase (PurE)-related protein